MPTGKNTPFSFSIIAVLLVLTLFEDSPQMQSAFLFSPLDSRLTYHFFHANFFHFAANALCVAIMRPSPRDILMAWIVASIATFLVLTPTIGFSAIIYSYIGLNIIKWKISIIDWAIFIASNLLTAFIPNIAFWMHFVAFSIGMTVYYINRKLKDILLGS